MSSDHEANDSNEYSTSNITILEKINPANEIFVISVFLNKLSEYTLFKNFKCIIYHHTAFFTFSLITLYITFFTLFYKIIPTKVFLIFCTYYQSWAASLGPFIFIFAFYTWLGLACKYHNKTFSLKLCALACILLEIYI